MPPSIAATTWTASRHNKTSPGRLGWPQNVPKCLRLDPVPNERLRAAMVEQGLTHHALAEELEVNVKSVERWVAGEIVPFPRNRHRLAMRLGRDESYLWPDTLTRDRAAALSESELVRIYPHRADVTADDWRQLF